MSRFVQNTNVQKVNYNEFAEGNERTDGKRWNRAQTVRFPEMLIESGSVKSRDGLRRVERAKDKTPDAVAVRKMREERERQREEGREKNLSADEKLTLMIRNAFGKDR